LRLRRNITFGKKNKIMDKISTAIKTYLDQTTGKPIKYARTKEAILPSVQILFLCSPLANC
ncbi:MAG: hypothetical protein WCZ89_07210, partial [Phycisphaerae bacterium]